LDAAGQDPLLLRGGTVRPGPGPAGAATPDRHAMRRGRRALLWLVPLALLAAVFLWREAPPGPTGAWLSRLGLQPRYDTVAGRRVRYVRTGEGPPVVLLHGFASSIYSWSEIIPELARDHDVVAVDFPAFGGSEVPPQVSRA